MKSFGYCLLACGLLCHSGLAESTNNSHRIQQPLPIERVKSISWEQLPEPVQNRFKWHAGAGLVRDLRSAILNGEKVYLGSFTENGVNTTLAFRQNGSIAAVRGINQRDNVQRAQATTPTAQNETGRATPRDGEVSTRTNATLNNPVPKARSSALVRQASDAVRIPLSKVPPQVRHTIGLLAESNQVQAVTRSTYEGNDRYDVTYFDDGYHTVRIAPNGTIMKKTWSMEEAAGAELPPARKP